MSVPTAAFSIQLQGFTPANRDTTVRLVNQATGATVERKTFLDGSLIVRDLDPGLYQVTVTHPNLIQPIDQRVVRLFPQPAPTLVPISIRPDLFTDTPIRDIPDADLGPVQQATAAVRDRLGPVAGKSPGEAIRAADWNTLVGAVVDLSGAVLQLTQLVSPKGHDHPEIADKINEVQENIRRFSEAFGKSLLQLQRELETESLRRDAEQVLDQASANQALRDRVLTRIGDLKVQLQADTPAFTRNLAATGTVIQEAINELAAGPNGDQVLANPDTQRLNSVAQQYTLAGSQVRAESELQTYQRTTTATGGRLSQVLRS
jgi:hypothetical protein